MQNNITRRKFILHWKLHSSSINIWYFAWCKYEHAFTHGILHILAHFTWACDALSHFDARRSARLRGMVICVYFALNDVRNFYFMFWVACDALLWFDCVMWRLPSFHVFSLRSCHLACAFYLFVIARSITF